MKGKGRKEEEKEIREGLKMVQKKDEEDIKGGVNRKRNKERKKVGLRKIWVKREKNYSICIIWRS